jgi:hypothetical protein
MSLVICSNSQQDGDISRQQNSIEEAFSFRNALSSTYKIPANAQVALQSAKLNIDGRIVFSRNNHRGYQYFGKKLNLDGTTAPQIEDTTSHPLLYQLTTEETKDSVEELSPSDFANRLQLRLNQTIYHPNMKDKITCEVLRNASSLDFKGFKIIYDQENTKTNNIPTSGFKQWYRKDGIYANDTSDFFSYSAGVFQRNASLRSFDVCAGVNTQYPLNLGSGDMEVNISSANANVNASGTEVEWQIGLSRFVNASARDGYINPVYFDRNDNDVLNFVENEYVHMDFGVARNSLGQLVCFHSVYDPLDDTTHLEEVKYWNNASSTYTGSGARRSLSAGQYTKVKFEAEGERMKAQIFNASGSVWETITSYLAGTGKDSMFHPIHQACWCLHPVFQIGSNASNTSGKMEFDEYHGIDITGYDPTKLNKGGWFENTELLKRTQSYCFEVEKRKFNQPADGTAYVQDNTNASGGVAGNHVLIMEQSDIYKPSFGANVKELLGFNRGVVDTAVQTIGSKVTFESVEAPSQINSMSLFLRLNNFGQKVVNAFKGNQSNIIAHLSNLETQSGRVTYEPSNLIWLDLDNPAELNVTDFDLSFNYINEQYARIVTGQSIVCLYFRAKDSKM